MPPLMTDEQKRFVIKNIGTLTGVEMAKELGVDYHWLIHRIPIGSLPKGAIPRLPNLFSEEDDDYITTWWGRKEIREIAKELDVTPGQLSYYARRYLNQPPYQRGFTPEEDQFIREHVFLLTNKEIAEELNREPNTIDARIKRLKKKGEW